LNEYIPQDYSRLQSPTTNQALNQWLSTKLTQPELTHITPLEVRFNNFLVYKYLHRKVKEVKAREVTVKTAIEQIANGEMNIITALEQVTKETNIITALQQILGFELQEQFKEFVTKLQSFPDASTETILQGL